MKRRWQKKYLPGILNGITGLGVLIGSFLLDIRLPMSLVVAKPLGMFIVFCGICLVVWATVHIKGAIMGEVEPELQVLVKQGPYRSVRHPVYLGMTIALAGVALSLRSLPGLIGMSVLFLSTEVYRARLEEKALAQMFGAEWENYARQTGFMLPIVRRR